MLLLLLLLPHVPVNMQHDMLLFILAIIAQSEERSESAVEACHPAKEVQEGRVRDEWNM